MGGIVHIVRHENPDTDSIVSAIAYTQLKQKLRINAIVCRLGELNPETDFVLKKFQVPKPVYVQDVRVKLYNVSFSEPLLLKKDDTIKEAWDRMGMRSTSILLAVGEAQKLIGVVSLSDMANILMNDKEEKPISLMRDTSCGNIRKALQGKFLYECGAYRMNGRIHILCSRSAEYGGISHRGSIVAVSDDLELQKRALNDRAGCVILVDVDIISREIICMAKEANRMIIEILLNMLQAARSMYHSPGVKLIMKRKIISFNNYAYIDDVHKQMSRSKFRSYSVVNNQGAVPGSISRYHLLNYQKKKLIPVGHSELPQSIDDLKETEILEVMDHHRIGNVETITLTRFRNEIIGSTVFIIARMCKEAGLIPEVKTAVIMCRAIISDIINFNSPATTPIDKELARELAMVAEIELDAIAEEVFGAVATVKGRTMFKILYNNFREYNIDGKRIAIGRISVADEQEIVNVQGGIRAYMEKMNEIDKLDLLTMCFTAADGSGSNLVFIGTLNYLVDEASKEDIMDELYFVDGVVSRKKQIIPTLSKCLESM